MRNPALVKAVFSAFNHGAEVSDRPQRHPTKIIMKRLIFEYPVDNEIFHGRLSGNHSLTLEKGRGKIYRRFCAALGLSSALERYLL